MLGRLNHVAIAVPNIADAAKTYRDAFGMGAKVSRPVPQPDQGVTTVFVELPNTKIELLEPLGPNSPLTNFLQKNGRGGIHHVCYEVEDIIAARDHMRAQGATIIGSATTRSTRPPGSPNLSTFRESANRCVRALIAPSWC